MKQLNAFFLALIMFSTTWSGLGVDTRPKNPLVTRYPAWVDNLMYWISAHPEVAEQAKTYRGELEVIPTNQYTKFIKFRNHV